MNNQTIFKTAYEISIRNWKLWFLGLFLSSGFNLHFWYGLSFFQHTRYFSVLTQHLFDLPKILVVIVVAALIMCGVVLVNYFKTLFFRAVHNELHSIRMRTCLLCPRSPDSVRIFPWKVWFPQIVLASMITVTVSLASMTVFKSLLHHAAVSPQALLVVFIALFALVVLLSLWNCLFVLITLWFQKDFITASSVAVELLFRKWKRIGSALVVSTVIFLGSIAIGSIIAFQVQQFLINGLPFVFSDILVAWRPFVTAIVGLLFFGWLILNNVWFNVVIIVLFDDIMKAKSSREDSVSHFKKPVSDGQSG